MTRESNFAGTFRRKMTGLWHRVENSISAGMPDLCGVGHNGVTSWVELKALGSWTRVLGLRREQVIWLRRWCQAGGRAWVLVKVGRGVLLVNGLDLWDSQTDVKGYTREQWIEVATCYWPGNVDWDELECALLS